MTRGFVYSLIICLALPAPDLIATGLLRPSQGQATATSAGQGGLWASGWLALPGGGSGNVVSCQQILYGYVPLWDPGFIKFQQE